MYLLRMHHMLLKIASPEKTIYQGDIKQVTLPTDRGDITILPNHAPLVTALKPGLIKILPSQSPQGEFVFSDNYITLSTSKGMAFIDGTMVRVVTATATTSPHESSKTLEHMRLKLEDTIRELKKKGSIEEIEKSLIRLEKLNADIQLAKIAKK